MQCSVMTYSFRRTFERGDMDIFGCIDFCQTHGLEVLEPWNRHLPQAETNAVWTKQVQQAAGEAGVAGGCLAIDGGHIFDDSPAERKQLRDNAYHWLDAAANCRAPQVRIDAGGPEDMPEPAFEIIVEGFVDLVSRAKSLGIEVLTENHWGPTKNPDNTLRLLDAVPGLGLLFDSHNWEAERRAEAWQRTAHLAKALHIKTFKFDEDGNEPDENLEECFGHLTRTGYDGVWGIESVPDDGDEAAAVLKTRALITRLGGA